MGRTMKKIQALPRPRAVLFDWDDTIVDNWDTAFRALNTALEHMGVEPWSEEETRRRSGPSARDLFSTLFGDRWQEADKVYYDTFNKLVLDNVRIHRHAEDLLRFLEAQDIFMAVVSNKRGSLLRKEVEHVGFSPLFGSIIGAGDAEADKPHAAPLFLALKESGIAPGPDVWFVGDSHTDMIAAHRAGCAPILIETKPPPDDLLKPNPPVERFKTLFDIMEYIKRSGA